LLRLAIRPVVSGKRVELIHTDNPYADLKPRDRGTLWVLWDSDSRLTVLEGCDDYRMVCDARNNQKAIGITSSGVIDFSEYTQGVYTLDVVVDDDKACEGIVVIGNQPQSNIEEVVKKVNTEKYFVDIIIEEEKKKQKHSICYFNPMDKECYPVDGKCPEGFGMNDDDRCVPTGDCPDGYGRADEDETGTCYKKENLKKCEDGSIRLPKYCRENERDFCKEHPEVVPCNPSITLQRNEP
jgi:hypothetical protein